MSKILAAIVLAGLIFAGRMSFAEDKKDETIKGILIDNACGKGKNEEAAAKHPKACCLKEGCVKSGYRVVSGDKGLKFDEKGNALAAKYLADKDTTTAVIVIGHVDGEEIHVTEIKAAPKKE